jgi:hypothetical protein
VWPVFRSLCQSSHLLLLAESCGSLVIPAQNAILKGVAHAPIVGPQYLTRLNCPFPDVLCQSYLQAAPLKIPGELPVYATSLDVTKTNDACAPLPADTPDLSNYLVLIHRGTCLIVDLRAYVSFEPPLTSSPCLTAHEAGKRSCQRRPIFFDIQVPLILPPAPLRQRC